MFQTQFKRNLVLNEKRNLRSFLDFAFFFIPKILYILFDVFLRHRFRDRQEHTTMSSRMRGICYFIAKWKFKIRNTDCYETSKDSSYGCWILLLITFPLSSFIIQNTKLSRLKVLMTFENPFECITRSLMRQWRSRVKALSKYAIAKTRDKCTELWERSIRQAEWDIACDSDQRVKNAFSLRCETCIAETFIPNIHNIMY